jgi:Wadjet protein JetD, C-terminal
VPRRHGPTHLQPEGCREDEGPGRDARSVVAALRAAFSFEDGTTADDVLATFGIARFRQPLLLRAALDFGGGTELRVLPYLGIPEELAVSIVAARRAPYLLIIENLTTFNRYVREVQDDGFVLYGGGYPTGACRVAAARLAAAADAAFHWGDIDSGGVRIFRVLEAVVEGLRPHLMTPEIARQRGREAGGGRRSKSRDLGRVNQCRREPRVISL